jgi:hypothetical protein
MRFWFLYYALFGGRAGRRAALLVFAILLFFFYCFVHEAFDSPTRVSAARAVYNPKPIKIGLPSAHPTTSVR